MRRRLGRFFGPARWSAASPQMVTNAPITLVSSEPEGLFMAISSVPWKMATIRMLPPVELYIHASRTEPVTMENNQPGIATSPVVSKPITNENSGMCHAAQKRLRMRDAVRALPSPGCAEDEPSEVRFYPFLSSETHRPLAALECRGRR